MLKKKITFEDYNGNTRTEDFYFNITKAELSRWYFEHGNAGILEHMKHIVVTKDTKGLMDFVSELISISYGIKSEDGMRFIKDPKLTRDFMQTDAYSVLYLELISEEDAIGNFLQGCLPKSAADSTVSKEDVMKYLYGDITVEDLFKAKTDKNKLELVSDVNNKNTGI